MADPGGPVSGRTGCRRPPAQAPDRKDCAAAMTDRLDRALLELAAALREELGAAARSTPDRLLDIPSAATALGIGRTRLYAELDSGRIRSVRVGRRRLIPALAIAEFVGRSA